MSKGLISKAYAAAKKVRKRAHAPYSGFFVGSAIVTSAGKIYTGCNVENASYGGTVCAERNAIFKAVSEEGKIQISDVIVITDQKSPWPPCGFCRQVISEFAHAKTTIHLANLKGIQSSLPFSELFPSGFSPKHLKK
jgi:cytidine deaminase